MTRRIDMGVGTTPAVKKPTADCDDGPELAKRYQRVLVRQRYQEPLL